LSFSFHLDHLKSLLQNINDRVTLSSLIIPWKKEKTCRTIMPKGLVLKGWLINNALSGTPIDRGMHYQKTLLRVGKPLWLASQGVNQMVHAKP